MACDLQDLREDAACGFQNTNLAQLAWANVQILCNLRDWFAGQTSVLELDVDALIQEGRCINAGPPELAFFQTQLFAELANRLMSEPPDTGVLPHNFLSATHPDTLVSPVSRGSLIVGSATPLWASFPIGAPNRILRSNGADPVWAQVVLTTDVSGVLPAANGGTNHGNYTAGSVLFAGPGGLSIEQTNSTFFWDFVLSRLGLGNQTPQVLLHLGTPGTIAGIIRMAGLTSGEVTLQTAAVAGTWTLTLPINAGVAGQVLTTDGAGIASWAAPTAFALGNPSSPSVSLVVSNGVAITAMRSDAVLALDQSIAPTWTGFHTFLAAALGVTPNDAKGILLTNTTPAVLGAVQISPALRWRGFDWETTGGTSQSLDMRAYLHPVQDTSTRGFLRFQSTVAGGAYSDRLWIETRGSGLPVASSLRGWTYFSNGDPENANTEFVRLTKASAGSVTFEIGATGTGAYRGLVWLLGGAQWLSMLTTGQLRIGDATGASTDAFFQIAPGTSLIAPLKFDPGTSLTAPVAGTMEYDGTSLFFTPVATRQTIAYAEVQSALTYSATPVIDFLGDSIKLITMTGNITSMTTSNRAAGRKITVILDPNGSARTITAFNASWRVFGAILPATLAIGKYFLFTIQATDANESGVMVAGLTQN